MPDHMKREQLCCHTDSGNSTAVHWFKTLKKKKSELRNPSMAEVERDSGGHLGQPPRSGRAQNIRATVFKQLC